MNHTLPRHPDGEGTGTLRAHPERDLIMEPKAKEFRSQRTHYRTNSRRARKGARAFPAHIQPILSIGTVRPGSGPGMGTRGGGARCGQTRSVLNGGGDGQRRPGPSRSRPASHVMYPRRTHGHPSGGPTGLAEGGGLEPLSIAVQWVVFSEQSTDAMVATGITDEPSTAR